MANPTTTKTTTATATAPNSGAPHPPAPDAKTLEAAIALWRFGLGAKEGTLAALGDDPRDLLLEEIAEHAVPIPSGALLHSSADLLIRLKAYEMAVNAERTATAKTAPATAGAAAGRQGGDMAMAAGGAPPKAAPTASMIGTTTTPMLAAALPPQARSDAPPLSKQPYFPQTVLIAETDARFNGTVREPLIGFGERLAMFWANHFAVATDKGGDVHILAGAFEREAIRPHLFGRFEDILLAVETHPAMLIFLDNQQSIGPSSPANKDGTRGLNENLAREILELHTLGVDGGYSQADVTSLARIITGWTVRRDDKKPELQGHFVFNAGAHEPGEHAVMGLTYADDGVGQGRTALADLARHPATARHLAFKLARHFVADNPPSALVDRLAAAYTANRGDLSAVYTALVNADEAWDPRLIKLRSPAVYLAGVLRASGVRPKPEQILAVLKALGQPWWNPSGPNGFPDVSDAWASAEGLATRIDAANLLAHMAPGDLDPRAFLADRLGPLASTPTTNAVARASSRPQGLSIAFLSPEFLRC
ncbi:DUF1800 domain-containing protein [Segnochrobactrum spirostomi]|uniref:DUF1800 family protein n=1 Tax=Segnochrobactrum spirostomi TaxID=2608987 RepID=A0A6A7Y713_9HYPH|nr:DUF1800 family protein [Segnochrobactrum spirostomi]MQT14495.1 DUF1800 family protein [Segnochrobactrum spirostomi]